MDWKPTFLAILTGKLYFSAKFKEGNVTFDLRLVILFMKKGFLDWIDRIVKLGA